MTGEDEDLISFFPSDFYKVHDMDCEFPSSLVENLKYSFSNQNFTLDLINENTQIDYNIKDTIKCEG